jgi:hypothetical protein
MTAWTAEALLIFIENDFLFRYSWSMRARLTSKNQLTLPNQAIEAMGHVSLFQLDLDGITWSRTQRPR